MCNEKKARVVIQSWPEEKLLMEPKTFFGPEKKHFISNNPNKFILKMNRPQHDSNKTDMTNDPTSRTDCFSKKLMKYYTKAI